MNDKTLEKLNETGANLMGLFMFIYFIFTCAVGWYWGALGIVIMTGILLVAVGVAIFSIIKTKVDYTLKQKKNSVSQGAVE